MADHGARGDGRQRRMWQKLFSPGASGTGLAVDTDTDTITLDFLGVPVEPVSAPEDIVLFYDVSAGGVRSQTISQFGGGGGGSTISGPGVDVTGGVASLSVNTVASAGPGVIDKLDKIPFYDAVGAVTVIQTRADFWTSLGFGFLQRDSSTDALFDFEIAGLPGSVAPSVDSDQVVIHRAGSANPNKTFRLSRPLFLDNVVAGGQSVRFTNTGRLVELDIIKAPNTPTPVDRSKAYIAYNDGDIWTPTSLKRFTPFALVSGTIQTTTILTGVTITRNTTTGDDLSILPSSLGFSLDADTMDDADILFLEDVSTTPSSLKKITKANLVADLGATGDVKMTIGTKAPTGWLLMNADTIGDVGGGATHAAANLEALFNLVKNLPPNAGTEVFGTNNVILPDMTRQIPIGIDAATTVIDAVGKSTGSWDHTHDVNIGSFTSGTNSGSDLAAKLDLFGPINASPAGHDHAVNPPNTTSTTENPPVFALRFIIKI